MESKKVSLKVSFVSIVVNVFLFIIKFLTGIISKSSSLFSDAIHSLTDVLSNIVVIIGVKLSNKEADKEHPYGHERMESIAALILSGFLIVTGISIGYDGLLSIINKEYLNIEIPGILALIVAVICIIIKESMYWYVRYNAKKINSGTLLADAWHHRTDALATLGSFVGILLARLGYPIFDSIAAILICFFILKAAIDIFKDATNRLIDKSCDEETINLIRDTILQNDNVIKIEKIMTRLFGNKIYVDVEIVLDGDLTLCECYLVAASIHDDIEEKNKLIKHCMIRVLPFNNK